MTIAPVRFEMAEGIAWLTLDRPEVGNAIDLPMAEALAEAAARCETDEDIRCVVLSGSGRIFCAGGDLRQFAAAGDGAPAMLDKLARTLNIALTRLATMRKPLLTLVNGPAAGAGLSLAICGDIVLCSDTAHFTAAYGALGLTPDGGMSWWLPRLVGLRRAQDIILSNRRVKAEEAATIGLITRIVAAESLMDEGRKTAAGLAAGATHALGDARELLRESYENSLQAQLDREVKAIVAAGATAAFRERIARHG